MQAVASSGLSTVRRLLWGFVLCFILREIVVLKESALEGGVLFLIVGGLNRVYRGRAVPINLWKTGIPSETPTCPIGGREGDAKGEGAGRRDFLREAGPAPPAAHLRRGRHLRSSVLRGFLLGRPKALGVRPHCPRHSGHSPFASRARFRHQSDPCRPAIGLRGAGRCPAPRAHWPQLSAPWKLVPLDASLPQ